MDSEKWSLGVPVSARGGVGTVSLFWFFVKFSEPHVEVRRGIGSPTLCPQEVDAGPRGSYPHTNKIHSMAERFARKAVEASCGAEGRINGLRSHYLVGARLLPRLGGGRSVKWVCPGTERSVVERGRAQRFPRGSLGSVTLPPGHSRRGRPLGIGCRAVGPYY